MKTRNLRNGIFLYLSSESNTHIRQLAKLYNTSMSAIVDELLFTMKIGTAARQKTVNTKHANKKSRKN